MNIVKSVLDLCIKREGKIIVIDGKEYRVLFRLNDGGSTEAYTTMFAPKSHGIEQGKLFDLYGDTYLILQQNTSENVDYQKFDCVKCDERFKVMYGLNDVVDYYCYSKDISSSKGTYKFGLTTSSKQEFILPLNADTKRIKINTRFFSGFYDMAWKVVDVNYRNGLCYLYCERSQVASSDDIKDGIADRWMYEQKPYMDRYEVKLSTHELRIATNDFNSIGIQIYQNGTLMDNPLYEDLGEDDMIQYLSISFSNENQNLFEYSLNEDTQSIGIESADITGTEQLTVSYKVNENDECISDRCMIEVYEDAENQIHIEPKLNYDNSYSIKQDHSQLFSFTADGVDEPMWSIDVDFNGNESNATVLINEVDGTIEITNKGYSAEPLIVKVIEESTELEMDFKVELDRYF